MKYVVKTDKRNVVICVFENQIDYEQTKIEIIKKILQDGIKPTKEEISKRVKNNVQYMKFADDDQFRYFYVNKKDFEKYKSGILSGVVFRFEVKDGKMWSTWFSCSWI